jgi:hypothetical protein
LFFSLIGGIVSSSVLAAQPQIPFTCKNKGDYPRIEEYFSNGQFAGYDVYKSDACVEDTVSTLPAATGVLHRLCADKAALESFGILKRGEFSTSSFRSVSVAAPFSHGLLCHEIQAYASPEPPCLSHGPLP